METTITHGGWPLATTLYVYRRRDGWGVDEASTSMEAGGYEFRKPTPLRFEAPPSRSALARLFDLETRLDVSPSRPITYTLQRCGRLPNHAGEVVLEVLPLDALELLVRRVVDVIGGLRGLRQGGGHLGSEEMGFARYQLDGIGPQASRDRRRQIGSAFEWAREAHNDALMARISPSTYLSYRARLIDPRRRTGIALPWMYRTDQYYRAAIRPRIELGRHLPPEHEPMCREAYWRALVDPPLRQRATP